MGDMVLLTHAEKDKLKKAFDKAARWVHDANKRKVTAEDLNNEHVTPLISELNSVFSTAVAGIKHQVPEAMYRHMKENVYVFSGAKTYEELRQMSDRLLDDKGHIKPFYKFNKEVQAVHETYNKNYLEAEYIFATKSARMAARWAEYEADGDRYYLQYTTAEDDRVRYEHSVLNNITLPVSDRFWDKYFPPNGWRCRCNVEQVRMSKYEPSNSDHANQLGEQATYAPGKGGVNKSAMFRFNPGKEKIIFPKHHPYFPKSCATCTKSTKLAVPNDFCKFCTQIRDKALKMEVVETRQEARGWAKEQIPEKEPLRFKVDKEEFSELTVYRGTIKTFTAKPHKFEKERNLWATDLPGLIRKSTYYGWDEDEIVTKTRVVKGVETQIRIQKHEFVKRWLYYEVKVGGEKSYICIKQTYGNEFIPYCLDDEKAWSKHSNRVKREKPPI